MDSVTPFRRSKLFAVMAIGPTAIIKVLRKVQHDGVPFEWCLEFLQKQVCQMTFLLCTGEVPWPIHLPIDNWIQNSHGLIARAAEMRVWFETTSAPAHTGAFGFALAVATGTASQWASA